MDAPGKSEKVENDKPSSLGAIPGPADAVLPQARAPFLGVLMLDTRFPRPPGDIGHPDSFGVPVRQQVVPGAFPSRVVASARSLREAGMEAPFVTAARELAAQGARAITTSCGFLVLLQAALQAAVDVPVVSSSLLQLPALLAREAQVGVLTISASHLCDGHLLAAGVPAARLRDVLVQGMAVDGDFAAPILGNQPAFDLAAARADVVRTALALQARAPQLRTVVLECTNLPPHAQAVSDATGWQLRSLLDERRLVDWWRDAP
jgi:hypothetical protein